MLCIFILSLNSPRTMFYTYLSSGICQIFDHKLGELPFPALGWLISQRNLPNSAEGRNILSNLYQEIVRSKIPSEYLKHLNTFFFQTNICPGNIISLNCIYHLFQFIIYFLFSLYQTFVIHIRQSGTNSLTDPVQPWLFYKHLRY